MISRRAVLKGAGAALLCAGCPRTTPPPVEPKGDIAGNHFNLGHRVRSGSFPEPSETIERSVVVVGGGMAGLSAVWRLVRAGVTNIQLVELAPEPGGTARGGANAVSAYPWGAHYLPVPNPESTLVIRLLQEMGLADFSNAAAPKFDARWLVHAPEDRLFFRGRWYDGLYLHAGASAQDERELHEFREFVRELRGATGRDGRPAFAIPSAASSRDPEVTRLDGVTMSAFMDQMGWRGERIRRYVDYACKDDYGATLAEVSAWAALHYFCGRRPIITAETDGTHYFTWPEGNQRLVNWLRALVPHLSCGRLVHHVTPDGEVLAFEPATERTVRYRADAVVLATPNHVTRFVTRGAREVFADHAPWLVCNLTLHTRPRRAEPCWNNVIYDSPSQGWVEATHQRFGPAEPTVWTWYAPWSTTQRSALMSASWHDLSRRALKDISRAYGDMTRYAERVDVWRWGHGTVIPRPGVMFSGAREKAGKAMGRVAFAHTDLSGLPLFEEAQYRGVVAAEVCLDRLGVKHDTWV